MFSFKKIVTSLLISSISLSTYAQDEVNSTYKHGLELLEKRKYVAAAQQFSQVQNSGKEGELSLLRENAAFYQALCAIELGKVDAENLFLEFVYKHPENTLSQQAYYQLGRTYFAKKDYTKTINWLTKTSAINLPASLVLDYNFKLGYAYFENKEYVKAEPLFGQLKNGTTAYAEPSTYYYAYINYLNADYTTALKEFERLKGSKTYEDSYPYYISALYFLDKRYNDVLSYALPHLKNINAKYETELLRIIAASYFANSAYIDAANYYQQFQDKDKGQTQNNQDNYQIGYAALQLKNYTKAIAELEKIETADEFFQSGMLTLGESFLATGNKQGARNAFFKSAKVNYDKEIQEEGAFNYAKLSYELEFHQVALDATQEFISNYPYSKKINEAKTLLGEILLTTKNYKDAIDILESIPNKNKDAQEVYQKVCYYRGLEFYNERAFQNAISVFMRSNKWAVDDEIAALATYWMAESMYEVRKFSEAIDKFQAFLTMPAARKTGVYNFANYALGYAYFEDENYYKSAFYFENFLKGKDIDENTKNDASLRLADAYFVQKNYPSALLNYNKIIENASSGEDYALFQRGMIQGLQGENDAKIATHEALLAKYIGSNYADDASFEIANTYFIKGDFERAKTDLNALLSKYPRSSYVARALVTIGLVQYNQDANDAALETFKKVVNEYSVTDEAQQALAAIKNIYMDKSDADGYLAYANTTNIGNLSVAEQDNLTFQAVNNRFTNGETQTAVDAVDAYFDKFPNAIHTKQARFIRAECLVKLQKPDLAIPDYEFILNDWTSDYTERALISIAKIYLIQKKYNEAIVHLKKLELTSEYRANYGFVVNNLMESYASLSQADETLKYAELVKNFEKSSEEDKLKANLFAAKAYLLKNDSASAFPNFKEVSEKTKTILAAEARYQMAAIQFQQGEYKAAQQTAFDLIKNLPSFDYWVAKSFLLLADTYLALKDEFQAKSTLQSLLDNYTGNDEIIPAAKEKLEALNKKN